MENINEEKREKFVEVAGKRVNNVIHDIEILKPIARSYNYDYSKSDVGNMFSAMQEALDCSKEEFLKRFEKNEKSAKKVFSFGTTEDINTEIFEEGGLE